MCMYVSRFYQFSRLGTQASYIHFVFTCFVLFGCSVLALSLFFFFSSFATSLASVVFSCTCMCTCTRNTKLVYNTYMCPLVPRHIHRTCIVAYQTTISNLGYDLTVSNLGYDLTVSNLGYHLHFVQPEQTVT